MTQRRESPLAMRVAVLGLVVVGVIAALVAVLGGGGGSGALVGAPAPVRAAVGADPAVVTLHGPVLALISAPDVDALARFEARLGDGQLRTAAGAPVASGAYGPASWLAGQIAVLSGQVRGRANAAAPLAAQLVRAGSTGRLGIDDGSLTSSLTFGATGTAPLHRLAWLFPNGSTARIFVRLASGVSPAQGRRTMLAAVAGLHLPGVTATLAQK